LVVLTPVVVGLFVSVFFFIAAAIWMFLVPLALRDVWRPVRVGSNPPKPSLLPSQAGPDGDTIASRRAPTRW
jgi:hypothetical protein